MRIPQFNNSICQFKGTKNPISKTKSSFLNGNSGKFRQNKIAIQKNNRIKHRKKSWKKKLHALARVVGNLVEWIPLWWKRTVLILNYHNTFKVLKRLQLGRSIFLIVWTIFSKEGILKLVRNWLLKMGMKIREIQILWRNLHFQCYTITGIDSFSFQLQKSYLFRPAREYSLDLQKFSPQVNRDLTIATQVLAKSIINSLINLIS